MAKMAFSISIQSLYGRYVADKASSCNANKEEMRLLRDSLAEFINYCVDVGTERTVVLSQKKVGGEEYLLNLREFVEKMDILKDFIP